MKLSLFAAITALLVAAGPATGDHPLLSRMPGFHLDDQETREFDVYEFLGTDGEELRVEGRFYYFDYGLDEGARVPSELQILRNHTNAVEQAGGETLYVDDYNAHMRLAKDGRETWIRVRVYNQATAYALYIVERQTMTQEVVVDAETMARQINATGSATAHGIYFDFDRAEIRPESAAALREIARLLADRPDLRVHVVGHTDNVGGLDYNLDLSMRRARAVVAALVSDHGVAAQRLRPAGVGPLAPAAPNTTEEGRARNRRVELVEQ